MKKVIDYKKEIKRFSFAEDFETTLIDGHLMNCILKSEMNSYGDGIKHGVYKTKFSDYRNSIKHGIEVELF